MNLALWLWRTAQCSGDTPALFTGTQCKGSYTQFAERSAAIAAGLRDYHHIEPSDRVALFLANDIEYLPLLFGIWAAGAVAVPINCKLHAREATWIISDAGAKLCFADSAAQAALIKVPAEERITADCVTLSDEAFERLCTHRGITLPVERATSDLAWLFYTSGTTGRPKGVMLSHGNLQAMTYAYLADVDYVMRGGATVYAAPISHGAGLYSLVHVLKGSAHVVPASGGFDPAEVLVLGKHFRDVSLFAAPTMVKRLVTHSREVDADGEGLRTIIYGGGPMYLADIEEAVLALGDRFVQIYGQGESPMTITTLKRETVADRAHPHWRERLASVGTPHSCVEIRVVNEAAQPLPIGETGEIIVRGATVMQGYWNNREATAATLRNGWLWTGDLGSLDADGFLTLKDRSKDVIISGGSNIYPREVEEALLTHSDVAEACVVGRAHSEWGEEVVAFVVARNGRQIDASALDQHCLQQIARFKRPKHYCFVDALPKNNYGKVLKTELRKRLASAQTFSV
jgi:long-chain acyl-CoA synthetase